MSISIYVCGLTHDKREGRLSRWILDDEYLFFFSFENNLTYKFSSYIFFFFIVSFYERFICDLFKHMHILQHLILLRDIS